MPKRSRKVRSAPLYVQAGSEILSLVSEVGVSEAGAENKPTAEVRPLAVHVIDGRGVHSIPAYSINLARILRLLFFALLAPLQYAFFKRREKR